MSTSTPELPGLLVHRPRLSQLLDGAMSHPVTLLTAPPGWGKTATLRSWLDHRSDPGPVTWLRSGRTDPSDLAAQLGTVAARPTADPAVVILDDLRDAAAISAQLEELIQRAGDRMRLVVATRDDTALPVPRWRLSDQVAEVGCADLAFTLAETAELLAAHTVTLPTPELEALHARTEGWPAGIRFAALRSDSPDPLSEERRDVARYLEAEALGQLPARTRDLLRHTSVLDRVSGELADAIGDDLGDGGGERVLEGLSAAGGFVLALGGSPIWYRYHRQFRDALRADLRRSQPQRVDELHRRAARWLSQHDMTVDAIRHAWASGDHAEVATLGQARWADLALAGCHVSAADGEAARGSSCDDAELALAYVVDRLSHGDAHGADTGLNLMARSGQSMMAVRALRLARDRVRGDLPGVAASAAALLEVAEDENRMDPRYAEVRTVAVAAQAAGMLGAGDLTGAADALAATGPAGPDGPACAARATAGIRSIVLAVSGDLRGAERAARGALAAPPCSGQPRDVHCEPTYLALALVSHEWNRPAEADRFFELAHRSRRLTVEPELAAWSTLIGTWMRAARGDLTDAFDTLAMGRPAPGEPALPARLEPWFAAAEADLRIARGDTATARAELSPLLAEAGEGTAVLSVLLARALLRDGDPHAAARALPPWSDDEKADTVLSVRLDAGLIDAQVARALGDRRRAGQLLERVLDLAQPHGFRRPFSKDADAVRDLLTDHLESGTAHWSTVSALIEAPPQQPPADLIPSGEALTEREVTVLRYLQSMLSNEEIAAKLFVSVNTVKTHVRHIYRKLDVTHRRDAVRRARDVRLL